MAPPKAKPQKMGLGEFLTDSSLGNWADEMEDAPMPSVGRSSYSFDRSQGPSGATSSFADRGYSVRESLPLPSKPPFTVHLGNMSFDATEGDVMDFFAGCEVTHVRIVEDRIDKKPKGFAYAEFGSLEGLKKALDLNGLQFQGRNIRVSVAEPQKDRAESRDFDWSRKGPLPDIGGARKGPSDRPPFPGRDGNFVRENGDRPERKFGYEQGDGKVRDFGNWERKGPLQPAMPANAPSRSNERPQSREGFRDRKNSPAWGEGRSQDGSRPPRREFADRPAPERAPTAAEKDTQWRTKMRPDAPTPTVMVPTSSSGKDSATSNSPTSSAGGPSGPQKLTERPRLQLAKRTVSQAESPVQATSSDPKASPFGAARPIDTAAREKEIEDKIRQRKEQEEKAREEKRVADENAKEEKRQAKDAERAEKNKNKVNGNAKEGEGAAGTAKNYQILRRDASEDKSTAGEKDEAKDAPNGVVTPEETAAMATEGEAQKPNDVTNEATNTNPAEEDGWSTVSKPVKKGRSGHSSARGG